MRSRRDGARATLVSGKLLSTRRHFVLHMLGFVGVATLVYLLLVVLVQLAEPEATLAALVAGATAAAFVNALATR
ncbi:MAG: hypothetical protein ACTHMJ_14295 [Thermomicrobiales bacterium]|nr:hypothetical protein [Thermomicrobiales bacterium]